MTQTEAIGIVETEYARKRAEHEHERDERVAEVRGRDPEIARLQAQIPRVFGASAQKILAHKEDAAPILDRLKAEVFALQSEISARLERLNLPADYLSVQNDCAECKDTGYVGEHNNRRCTCFVQRTMQLQFDYASTATRHSFEAFDPSIYPGASQRDQAETAKALCIDYADAFPHGQQKNLVLLGTSGLGKTFLLDSVAHRVIERGHVALCVTGFRMLEAMRAYHLGETQSGAPFEQMLSCPILLIDDLGTEPMLRNISIEYLFTLLNERIAARRHTVVATNLTPVQLNERYGERVVSRLLDQTVCKVIRLVGEDLRFRRHDGR